jgi:hypothetical protein
LLARADFEFKGSANQIERCCVSLHSNAAADGIKLPASEYDFGEALASALGQKLTSPPHFQMSALPPKADVTEIPRHVR